MVTKHISADDLSGSRSVLAKILMVTKLGEPKSFFLLCSVLAKILMVTKPHE